jgi:uncharacterized protein (DUF342 family)
MGATPYSYSHIGPQQQDQVVEQRLQQYEMEHYSHTLNRMALEQASDIPPEDKRQQIEQIDRTLASLESSIETHRREQDRLRQTTQAAPAED